jgi:hypothetical protein
VLSCYLLRRWWAPCFYTMVWKGALKSQRKSWPIVYIFLRLDSSTGPRPTHRWGFEITLRHTSLGTTPLDELIGSSQRPLPGSSQESQQTDVHFLGEIWTRNPNKRRQQIRALGREVTVIGLPSNSYF